MASVEVASGVTARGSVGDVGAAAAGEVDGGPIQLVALAKHKWPQEDGEAGGGTAQLFAMTQHHWLRMMSVVVAQRI